MSHLNMTLVQVLTMAGLWYVPVVWLVLSEILSAITFRDNLIIGTLQTFWPQVRVLYFYSTFSRPVDNFTMHCRERENVILNKKNLSNLTKGH